MTIVQVKHVVSCTSEDTLHKADNLLKGDSYKKWTGGSEGEKQVSVILQLDKASNIHSIDVGNESSAFVEILGGHSSSDSDDLYQVILVTSSFMSPVESRNNTNMNRVRMFGPESLSKAVADKKFDRIKIVCTQPFNKRCKYGLSFIKLHGPPGAGDQQEGTSGQPTLGKFRLKEESKSSLSVGSFFKGRDTESTQKPLTGAAAVRAASSIPPSQQASSSSSTSSPKQPSQSSTKRRLSDADKKEGENSHKRPAVEPKREEPRRKESVPNKSKESKPQPATGEAFGKLMKKVVFVMSGFQHPLRGELRKKATEMGAKYQADWGPGATHLICAFANTPKYNQVKGKGKIVKKEWILDSYRKRTLLPWIRYKLSSGRDSSSDESESEEEEEMEEEEVVTPVKPSSSKSPQPKTPTPKKPADVDEYSGSTDEEGNDTEPMSGGSSGDDTEDEIRKAQAKPKAQTKTSPKGGSPCKKGQSSSPGEIPDLPDFFSSKRFFLFGKFDKEERRQVNRFIIAFNGLIENYMDESVNYVITNSNWDNNFEEALSENSSITFVRPRWLYACNEKLKMVPYQPYIVVPAN
ncbi:DNA repair protein XRCC1 isoform X1 [Strongylocentrotus purpuratus]|uniref:DNA repair protein XRCC1 n=1 Tax=Strongylocentrotus purpuratus TaxID=7668 RepID=A0A7M7NC34_STRPU|nr:DNA repair protein XRCC1 isoform X1 [Strongylocentrotus purpuratus]